MIKYYNRETSSYEIEKVAGERYLNWTYSSPIGMSLLEKFIKRKLFSKFYGIYNDSKISKKKIRSFASAFNIDISESEKDIDEFETFNDFFCRKLSSKARPVNLGENILVSPCDARLIVHENINLNNLIQIKNLTYSFHDFIKNYDSFNKYENGVCLIFRLCPTDYHRFHFIDSGICEPVNKIKGFYYSVNPIALNKIDKVFCENKREWCVFHSENFGDVIYAEVGATCVGSIIQTYCPNKPVTKGSEKGYFKFGGSTIVLFFENNKIKLDEDILHQSSLGFETKVKIGEKIGTAQ